MMATVLQQTLGQSSKATNKQIINSQHAITNIIGGVSKSALITEEYVSLQSNINLLISDTEITRLLLSDANKVIVVSSSIVDIGSQMPILEERKNHNWQKIEISNSSGLIGFLAIEFSNKALASAYSNARDFGISLALIGMLIIAAIGVLVGFLLTRRLESITNTAQRLADGDYSARTNLHGKDEIGILAATFDKMVQRILEKEQNLAITLHSIGDAVITTDVDGNVTRMNQVAEYLTGWSIREASGQSLKTIFPIINATTRESISNPVDTVMETGEVVHLSNHTTLISKDGTEYQIADSAAPIRNNNQILGMVLVFNDVTEQYKLREEIRSSEQHLKLYREQAPLASIEWNPDFQVENWNKAAEKMFGYTVEEVRGRNFTEFMLPENAVVDVKQIWKDLISQEGGKHSLNENITKDGKIILCEWHNTVLKDESGRVIGAASIVQDITEREQREELLRRTQKMDALGKLTGGIAHDYNNMLGVILGFSELLENGLEKGSPLSNYVHEIQHAGERGAELTKKLLAFTRHVGNKAEMLNINTILNDIRDMLQKTLTVRIKLIFELSDALWPTWIDRNEFENAILNMCINAMHATDHQGQLTIRTHNVHLSDSDCLSLKLDTGDYISLSVTDTGSGMDKETKERIFDPFFSTKGESGTGLGLSQVYGFVERSRGAINVYSEAGHGTRFTLYFPRYSDNAAGMEKAENIKAENLSGNETILVVDDEPALLNLANATLGAQGYHVICANNAKEALKLLEENAVDIMFSDVVMPEMDGYQLAQIVQKKYPAMKIQLASGFSDSRNNNRESAALHKNLLHKPYSSSELLKCIRMRLDSTVAVE